MTFHRPLVCRRIDPSSGRTCPRLLQFHRRNSRTPGNPPDLWRSSSNTAACIRYKYVQPRGSCTGTALPRARIRIRRNEWPHQLDRSCTPRKRGNCKIPPCTCRSSFRQNCCYRSTGRLRYRTLPLPHEGHNCKANTRGTGNNQHCRDYIVAQQNWPYNDTCRWHRNSTKDFRSTNSYRECSRGSCSTRKYTGHTAVHRILHGTSTDRNTGHTPHPGFHADHSYNLKIPKIKIRKLTTTVACSIELRGQQFATLATLCFRSN